MNIEDKAKRYAQSVVDESVEDYIGDEIYNSYIEYASQCFTAGYTQAITDLSAENEKLREALREVTNYFSDRMKKEGGLYSYELDIYRKAKQLITDEK